MMKQAGVIGHRTRPEENRWQSERDSSATCPTPVQPSRRRIAEAS